MVEPIDSLPILGKLLAKSKEGRIPWQLKKFEAFDCKFDEGIKFEVGKADDVYWARMLDQNGNEIFNERIEDQIIFGEARFEELFNTLRDLYELARRKALSIDEKLADAAQALDRL